MLRRTIFLIFLIKINLFSLEINADEVLGCGGFIKSHADIDFSKVEVKLLTKQGSIKDTTDCSPSNGYYFIPLYDKGEYIIQISGPPGWSFEPASVNLNFDGKTDLCSLGKDVNFNFKGFGITGKIGVFGQENGAKNVQIELKSDNGKDIRKTISDNNGVFSFTPVIPGKYIIKASHDKWYFSKSEYTVLVQTGNTELPANALFVSGYDVQGKITSEGNIGFVLFSAKGEHSLSKCSSDNLPEIVSSNPNYERAPLCYVTSNTNSGDYIFQSVSPGKYLIKPYFQNKDIKFHIQPEEIEIEVIKDSVLIKENFEVTGFSVGGRVLSSDIGLGVPNAKINLNGQEVATTSSNGSYTLKNIKAGTYTIQAVAENLKFTDHTVKISSSNPAIPDITVSSFKICGQVISQKSHTVAITKHSSTFHTETQSKAGSGDWCEYLPNGKYSIEVLITESDKADGIQFFPLTQTIEVNSVPNFGTTFSQLRAIVTGEINWLTDADSSSKQMSVTMNALDGNGNKNGQYIIADVKDGKYSFIDILPGNYEVTVPQSTLCWDKTTVNINVKTAQEVIPTLTHIGYQITIISSHTTNLKYQLRSENLLTKEMKLSVGQNTFCVGKSGVYDISLTGCHYYDAQSTVKSFTTSSPAPITITALKHRTGVRILSEEQTNYKISVQIGEKKELITPVEETNKVDGYFSYKHYFNLKADDLVKMLPKSDYMLFKPDYKEIIGGNDCVDVAFSFIATKGLVINGRTEPIISGAKITLIFSKNSEIQPLITTTKPDGTFKFGPIDGSLEYEISAEKESYIFADYDLNKNLFKAHKLCEIIAKVKDEQGNKLSGVLLSLSGGESYRKNLVTGEVGSIKFHSLSPSQYYLRPMMKEYKFEPTSRMIEVKEGATVNVELIGKRVAYSVFGSINSLNGDPFSNVIVEAVSIEPCQQHQEESNTEINGQYRIRGLQPGCSYSIRIKSDEVNNLVDRSIPNEILANIELNDVRDVNIIGISPLGFVDVTARIMASQNEHYKTLRIQLYKKGSSDSPIYSQRVESPLNLKSKVNPGIMIFFPRIPLDGKTYFIEVTTSLSDQSYKYILPSSQFIANTSSIFVEFDFKPEVRSGDGDLNQNSISALLLIALVAIAFFKQHLILDLINFVWTTGNSFVQDILTKNKKKETNSRYEQNVDAKEIEQLAQSINAVKKKKAKKV